MQKERKLVTKLIVFLTLTINISCDSHKYDNSHFFARKIIEITKNENKDYCLNKKKSVDKGLLKKYYNFRFYNKPFYTMVTYDSLNKKIGHDTVKLKKDINKWKNNYKILDDTFSKTDLKLIINNKNNSKLWDINNIVSNNEKLPVKLCNNEDVYGYYISEPYYNENKNTALVIYNSHSVKTSFYIFQMKNSRWTMSNIITSKVR